MVTELGAKSDYLRGYRVNTKTVCQWLLLIFAYGELTRF